MLSSGTQTPRRGWCQPSQSTTRRSGTTARAGAVDGLEEDTRAIEEVCKANSFSVRGTRSLGRTPGTVTTPRLAPS